MAPLPRPWRAKALAQSAFAAVPGGRTANAWGQKLVTGTAELSAEHFADKWFNACLHLPVFHEFTRPPTVLELGTGWYPVTPLVLWLAGAHQVTTADIEDLWCPTRAGQSAAAILEALDSDPIAQTYTWSAERIDVLAAALANNNGQLNAPDLTPHGLTAVLGDVRHLDLSPGSIDLFTSNATLEHVPVTTIGEIFQTFGTLASDQARMSHYTDMADHYAYFDPSIGYFNFLRYSEKQWHKYNNRLHFQNRARVTTYRQLHADTGWEIIHEQTWSGDESALHSVPISADFRDVQTKHLLVKHVHHVSCLADQ